METSEVLGVLDYWIGFTVADRCQVELSRYLYCYDSGLLYRLKDRNARKIGDD